MSGLRTPDPRRQYLGAKANAQGRFFEERLNAAFALAASRGLALIEKTPEPMRPVKALGEGKFIAHYEHCAQPDYKGVLAGGRTVMFEAKYTTTGQIHQSRVSRAQAGQLDRYERMGAYCAVLVGFGSGRVYHLPWRVWSGMQRYFGHKYATEAQLESWLVPVDSKGTLLVLNGMNVKQEIKP